MHNLDKNRYSNICKHKFWWTKLICCCFPCRLLWPDIQCTWGYTYTCICGWLTRCVVPCKWKWKKANARTFFPFLFQFAFVFPCVLLDIATRLFCGFLGVFCGLQISVNSVKAAHFCIIICNVYCTYCSIRNRIPWEKCKLVQCSAEPRMWTTIMSNTNCSGHIYIFLCQ